MTLDKDSLTDWIQLTFTILGGLFALYLLRQSNKDKRNQFVLQVINQLYNDNEVRAIIYSVDTGRNVAEIRFGGNLEKEADKTLRYLDYIGYLIKDGSINRSDIIHFKYEINRILHHQEIINYIQWLQTIGVQLNGLTHLTFPE
jgi:hypothetical protein